MMESEGDADDRKTAQDSQRPPPPAGAYGSRPGAHGPRRCTSHLKQHELNLSPGTEVSREWCVLVWGGGAVDVSSCNTCVRPMLTSSGGAGGGESQSVCIAYMHNMSQHVHAHVHMYMHARTCTCTCHAHVHVCTARLHAAHAQRSAHGSQAPHHARSSSRTHFTAWFLRAPAKC